MARKNPKIEMTLDRKETLTTLMEWYWESGEPNSLISKADYSFVYDIWDHGLSYYGTNVQKRLNKIREIYLNDLKNDK